MNYALTGLFTVATTLGIAGIATANPIAIGIGGVAFGVTVAGVALSFVGEFAGAFLDVFTRQSSRPPQTSKAGIVAAAFIGVMAGLGVNELTLDKGDAPQAPASMSVHDHVTRQP